MEMTDRFALGERNEAGTCLINFCIQNELVITNTCLSNPNEGYTLGHHQMETAGIELITFRAGEDYGAPQVWQTLSLVQI